VAVYDVENLKRLPQVAIPPDDNPRKIMVVRDVAFRPDEKSVVFVYYHEWNTHGMKKEESSALAERENIPSDRRRSPAFAEMDISSGQVRGEKKFEGLFLRKRELWSLKISPDSSMLSYIHEFKDPENHRYTYSARDFSFYNTYTWEENTVIQDPKHEDVFFYSYRADLKKIYFVYRKKKEFKPGQKITAAVLNTREDTVFAEFDLADGTTRDIASAYSEGMPGTGLSQFSVSPDGKRAAVTGMEAYSGKYSFYLLIVSLDSQEKPIVKKMKLIRGLAPEAPEYTLWFDPLSVMLTIPLAEVKIGVNEYASFRPRFFYVNLTKELISNEPD
jgi:hypothetical protein